MTRSNKKGAISPQLRTVIDRINAEVLKLRNEKAALESLSFPSDERLRAADMAARMAASAASAQAQAVSTLEEKLLEATPWHQPVLSKVGIRLPDTPRQRELRNRIVEADAVLRKRQQNEKQAVAAVGKAERHRRQVRPGEAREAMSRTAEIDREIRDLYQAADCLRMHRPNDVGSIEDALGFISALKEKEAARALEATKRPRPPKETGKDPHHKFSSSERKPDTGTGTSLTTGIAAGLVTAIVLGS